MGKKWRGEGKEGGEKKGREKGEEEKRGYKLGKVKQFLWVNHSQHVRVGSSPTTGEKR